VVRADPRAYQPLAHFAVGAGGTSHAPVRQADRAKPRLRSRATYYAESVRRGGALVTARADDCGLALASGPALCALARCICCRTRENVFLKSVDALGT
jgi:hypothetical protein